VLSSPAVLAGRPGAPGAEDVLQRLTVLEKYLGTRDDECEA